MKKSVLIGALAAVLGVAGLARANDGGFIVGARLAYNHTYADLDFANPNNGRRTYNDGGYGVEAGLAGRYAIVPGELGFHIGANFIYRQPILTSVFDNHELVASVPLLFEINPFQLSGLRSWVYEMIFLQIGVQAEYIASYNERLFDEEIDPDYHWIERMPFDIGIVIGAVGYFNAHLSLDLRAYIGVTKYGKNGDAKKASTSQGSLGLSYYF